jgi:hypothetical protein
MIATIAKGILNGRFCGTLLLLSANDQMQRGWISVIDRRWFNY